MTMTGIREGVELSMEFEREESKMILNNWKVGVAGNLSRERLPMEQVLGRRLGFQF